jgi:hypothetical protein
VEKSGDSSGVSHPGQSGIDDDADPEVTAITRRLDRTGDTLGAIHELEALIVERTGQIPVITPEVLAAAARAKQPAPAEAAVAPAPVEVPDLDIDWSIPEPVELDPAPGFGEWADPELTAAAIDDSTPDRTDVSTKVFAVFSADPPAVEPEPPAASAGDPDAENVASVHIETWASDADEIDELDGIDDLDPEALAPRPATPPRTAPPTAPAAESAPVATPAEQPKRRRFWPFGRR